MFKKISAFLIVGLLLAYIGVFAIYRNSGTGENLVCKELLVEVVDTLERHYISQSDIVNMLKNAGISPVGKELQLVNTAAIENKLEENKLIKRAECYKTIGGSVNIKIHQRIPVIRIFNNQGNFFMDEEGVVLPVPRNFSAYIPVASGSIDKEYAKDKLLEFAFFLQSDKFWNSLISQIYVAPNGDVELTPVVGNHQIILGKMEDYKDHLDKLRLFYEKGLNKVGWNKYSIINLKYKNQVVCTKIDN
ncbi:cell division protein FtsQ [Bacteroidia bacterium]|nr:cell division protein FtsQ [Bacteroidia bacterium]